ncbi:MAG TPA: ATP-binding protein [Clostridia bacterium]|nr:ATP-binding protein [Clostridia bacterium]
MSDIYLKEILREYDEIQNAEYRALGLRRQEIFDNIPDIAKIHNDIVELMAQNSRKVILSSDSDPAALMTELQHRIDRLKAQEIDLLKQNGYPEDYLEMQYRCENCKDTGYTGFPIKEKCNCLTQKLLERTYRLSNIQELEAENFQTFDPMVFPEVPLKNSRLNQREYMTGLRDRLIDYIAEFPNNEKRTILFTGKTGLGKTFLLNCMAKSIMDNGYTVIRISAYKLFDQLFYSAISDNTDNLAQKRSLFDVDALIIDDLGTETRRNNFTIEDLFNIINERTLKRTHTFLSTNLGLSNLSQRYTDRIASRLFDSSNTMIIRFQGMDIRLKNKAHQYS